MNGLTNQLLILFLFLLIILSAFFSGSETAMMSINRYRLRHKVRKAHGAAIRVSKLLERPDRILGVILIGNTFANIVASVIATLLAVRFFGDVGVFVVTLALMLVILIFSEIAPKTVAALYPERISFIVSVPLKYLLYVLHPVVWLANGLVNTALRLFKIKVGARGIDHLTHEELRTIVNEATGKMSSDYQAMMLSVLDLKQATIGDIMVPRGEIIGIDITLEWKDILKQLTYSEHTRLPVYSESIDQVKGMLHVRKALNLLAEGRLNKQTMLEHLEEMRFFPEGTSLDMQLLNFQRAKVRTGLIVDEYGDIQGLATLEDILEEIVGEFTTDTATQAEDIKKQKDGSYLVEGGVTVRELNRVLGLTLSTEGPKTMNGLILEHLEAMPETKIGMRLSGYPVEVVEVSVNAVKWLRLWPKKRVLP